MSGSNPKSGAAFGVIGLAVMGKNLALNVADHGFRTAVWNRDPAKTAEFVAEAKGMPVIGTNTLPEFLAALERPRRIFLMIKAGDPVDQMIAQLLPLVEPGDIIMDGGNSRFQDTKRRETELKAKGLHFMGVGVSGGEEGARYGPALMPGGSPSAYSALKGVFEAIAAKSDSGPCVTHVGPDGAGHFVKMVHNGIEYADMQLLAEAYDLLSRGFGQKPDDLAKIFGEWNKGPLESFLVEITSKVFQVKDPASNRPLVDLVLDKAGQKGTGKWTAEVALDLAVPIPTIAAAIDARVLSSMKDERVAASKVLPAQPATALDGSPAAFIKAVHDALLCAKICCYAQGMDLIRKGSDANSWGIDLRETARIWKAGCIIRARLLDDIMGAYREQPALRNLLLAPRFSKVVQEHLGAWRRVVAAGITLGIPMPAFTSALSYFDSYRTPRLPQNLTQAQRDAFGSHTYERADDPARGFIHTQWL